MKYADLARKLVNCGCAFDRQAKGSHQVWRSRINGKRTTVPDHGSKDLAEGTISVIRRDLGIDKKDFDKA